MFGRKKDAAKISGKSPVFHVRYIGCTETHVATGTGCSYAPVQRLWDNSLAERNMRKVAIIITPMGLNLRDVNEKSTTTTQQQERSSNYHQQQQQQQQQQQRQHSQNFSIENISFCNVDRAVNDRIFSWIYRSGDTRRLDCHAVLCSTVQKAQTMTIVLSRAFQIAYKDWRAHHRDYETRSPSLSPTSKINKLSNARDPKRNNASVPSPSPHAAASAAAASQPTSHPTSSMTSSARRNADTEPSEENQVSEFRHDASAKKATHFFEDVTVTCEADPPASKDVSSSVSALQPSEEASSYFVGGSSYVWDPEVGDLVEGVDSLQADLDLEEHHGPSY